MHKRTADQVNIFAYISVLSRHRKLIGAVTGAFLAVSVILSLLLPNYYAGKTSIMPSAQDSSSLMSAAATASFGALLDIKSPSDVWVGILTSNTVRDDIIARFNLKEVYGKETIEDARKKLDKMVSISRSKDEIVTVTVADWKPENAAAMANAFVEVLDKVNRNATMTSGKIARIFIEKRLLESKEELKNAEERIRQFSKTKKAFKLDDQSKALIDLIGELNGQLMGKEVALDALKSYATDSHPQVQILKVEIEGLRRQIHMAQAKPEGSGGDIFIPVNSYPDISLEYARLMRDVMIQETLFETLTQQYELARIQEAKDSPTIQVLDRAGVPEKKAGPHRAFIVIVSIFFGVFSSCSAAFLIEYLREARTAADNAL